MNAATPECTTRQADFRGWNACYLENEFVRLVAVPDIGGRVMAYDLGPYPFLFVDPSLAGKLFSAEENQGDGSLAAWKNYGGDKTWPAPQGWDNDQEWHGPPDPILDTGRYTLNELSCNGRTALVRMTSPPDPRTGIQITRQLTMNQGTSRILLEITFRNITNHPVRWGIWDIIQLRAERQRDDGTWTFDPGCVVTVPVNPDSKFDNGFIVMFGETDNSQWRVDEKSGLLTAPYLWQIGKIGLDSPAGWIAFSNTTQGYAFAKQFEYIPGADYPDDGASVEVWTIGAGQVGNLNYEGTGIHLMEAEVLSPLQTIIPGSSASFTIEWGVCRCEGTVQNVSEGGVITQALSAVRQADGFVHLFGAFGVFDSGQLHIHWLNASGETIHSRTFGAFDPLVALKLNRVIRPPDSATGVQLCIVDSSGKHMILAEAKIRG